MDKNVSDSIFYPIKSGSVGFYDSLLVFSEVFARGTGQARWDKARRGASRRDARLVPRAGRHSALIASFTAGERFFLRPRLRDDRSCIPRAASRAQAVAHRPVSRCGKLGNELLPFHWHSISELLTSLIVLLSNLNI